MNNIIISVIIPVYNVEKYISNCLNSVLNQLNDKIEVVIIDDGSTDNSAYIIKQLIDDQLFNIKFVSQNNLGLSSVRNRGIELSCGQYIMFLDSDDELAEDTFSVLLNRVKRFPEVDIFYYDATIINEMNDGIVRKIYNRKNQVPDNIIFDSMEYFRDYYVATSIVSACLCLIKKKILLSNNIKFDEGRLYEDNVFSLNVLIHSKKVCYLAQNLYLRRYRENSITTGSIQYKNIEDICFVIDSFLNLKRELFKYGSVEVNNVYLSLIYKVYIWGYKMMQKKGWSLYCMSVIRKKLMEFSKQWPLGNRGLTYQLFRYLISDDKNLPELEIIRKYIIYYKKNIFLSVQKYEPKKIAIYGKGKHTRIFLEEYKDIIGKPLEFTAYIDTYQEGGYEIDGKPIVNIRDIKSIADVVIISSYEYRLEMLKRIRELILDDIIILDFYKTEKINIFQEDYYIN